MPRPGAFHGIQKQHHKEILEWLGACDLEQLALYSSRCLLEQGATDLVLTTKMEAMAVWPLAPHTRTEVGFEPKWQHAALPPIWFGNASWSNWHAVQLALRCGCPAQASTTTVLTTLGSSQLTQLGCDHMPRLMVRQGSYQRSMSRLISSELGDVRLPQPCFIRDVKLELR